MRTWRDREMSWMYNQHRQPGHHRQKYTRPRSLDTEIHTNHTSREEMVSSLCWRYHAIDVAHSAVGHSQSPDPLSGTCFQTNSETPTALSLHSDSHWRHSSLTSISALQRIRGVTIMRYINLHFTYLLTWVSPGKNLFLSDIRFKPV